MQKKTSSSPVIDLPLINNDLFFSSVARLGSSRAGDEEDEEPPITIRLQNVFLHPLYKKISTRGSISFDVAILVLKSPVVFNDAIRPICLPAQPVDAIDHLAGQTVSLTGWGKYFINATTDATSSSLKFTSLTVKWSCIC